MESRLICKYRDINGEEVSETVSFNRRAFDLFKSGYPFFTETPATSDIVNDRFKNCNLIYIGDAHCKRFFKDFMSFLDNPTLLKYINCEPPCSFISSLLDKQIIEVLFACY